MKNGRFSSLIATGFTVATFAYSLAAEANAQQRDRTEVMRPAGIKAFAGSNAELAAIGAKLFRDEGLSTNKMSCNSCHDDFGAFSEGFKQAYPHRMSMAADIFGLEVVEAEQVVQLCMLVPMEAKMLAWDSHELAALTAYVLELQKAFAARK